MRHVRQKFKIHLQEEQLKIVRLMTENRKRLILFDDTSTVMIESLKVFVPMHIFNSIEMAGLLVCKKIGPETFAYKLNTCNLQKVENL